MKLKRLTAALLCCALSVSMLACGKTKEKTETPSVTQAENSRRDQTSNGAVYSVVTKRATDYDLSTISADDFVKAMALGWNLGNTLDATGGDGKNPISQETSWGNPEVTQELIQGVADSGFTTIRIPVTWMNFTDESYHIDESMLERVKQIVDWSLDAGLFVIINTHHECYDPSTKKGWVKINKTDYKESGVQLCAMWTQIAEYFKDYDERLIFEGLNEPRSVGVATEWTGTNEQWMIVNLLGLDFVDAVRATGGYNATRFLMVPCYAATSSANVWKDYEFPDNDDRVILSIHAYTPYNFALNVDGTDTWSADNEEDTRDIDNLFNSINEVVKAKGHTAVIGEYGAMAKGMNVDSRVEWSKYYASKAAESGIPIIWWDNGAFTGEGELFGLIRRTVNAPLYTNIVEALINSWYGSDFHFEG